MKVHDDVYEKLDKEYLLRTQKEPFGYACLTNEKNSSILYRRKADWFTFCRLCLPLSSSF